MDGLHNHTCRMQVGAVGLRLRSKKWFPRGLHILRGGVDSRYRSDFLPMRYLSISSHSSYIILCKVNASRCKEVCGHCYESIRNRHK